MVENNYLSSSNKIHHHTFHLLLYVAEVLSSLNIRERQTIQIEFVNLARQT
jgi:hypothetical protein